MIALEASQAFMDGAKVSFSRCPHGSGFTALRVSSGCLHGLGFAILRMKSLGVKRLAKPSLLLGGRS